MENIQLIVFLIYISLYASPKDFMIIYRYLSAFSSLMHLRAIILVQSEKLN